MPPRPRGDTRFLGWVQPADLEGLYAVGSCFVFPSLYEGFGLPVLEAMASGVPVACSDRGSLAEVAGRRRRSCSIPRPRTIVTRSRAFSETLRCDSASASPVGSKRNGSHGARQLVRHVRSYELHSRVLRSSQNDLERTLERKPPCSSGGTSPASSRAVQGPPGGRERSRPRAPGAVDAAIVPLTPSSTSSVAALSGPSTTTTGTPRAAASMTTRPYPRASTGARGRGGRQSAARGPRRRRIPAPRRPVEPELAIARRTSRARARRRRSRRRRSGICSRARASAGTSDGTRFSGM